MGIANVYIRYLRTEQRKTTGIGRSEQVSLPAEAVPPSLHCRGGAARREICQSPNRRVLGSRPRVIANPILWRSRLHPEDRERVLNLEGGIRAEGIRRTYQFCLAGRRSDARRSVIVRDPDRRTVNARILYESPNGNGSGIAKRMNSGAASRHQERIPRQHESRDSPPINGMVGYDSWYWAQR